MKIQKIILLFFFICYYFKSYYFMTLNLVVEIMLSLFLLDFLTIFRVLFHYISIPIFIRRFSFLFILIKFCSELRTFNVVFTEPLSSPDQRININISVKLNSIFSDSSFHISKLERAIEIFFYLSITLSTW